MKRIQSLDGVRGTFIIMVIIAHALETIPGFEQNHQMSTYFIINTGQLGVKMFFVMSGYLITKLLLLEREKTGRVDLKDFYLRRMFRIFPTFFLYIFALLILKWTLVPDIFTHYSLILVAVFYLWNYKHFFLSPHPEDKGNWFLGHFWSLSMEEQFYLLWPVTFVRFQRTTLIKIVVGIVLIMPLLRVITFLCFPASKPYVGDMLHTGGDAILIGCLAALVEEGPGFRERYLKYFHNISLIAAVAIFLFILSPILTLRFKAAYNLTIGFSLNNLSIMILLYWSMYVPSSVSKFFNTRIISQLGVASYSLYVWQQLFLTTKNDFWVNRFPQNIIVAVVVGLGSHYFIEKPVLKLKNRFKKV
ncbi:acyltransferase [Pedobacter nutrimenti]|uniref:acyltransferase family protein n=1 Tax=Pedobacter nutrimenti TaxID=1241337 RepID=UPI00292E7577|nr:acyltransferase [Pedobacter nutrimenti]